MDSAPLSGTTLLVSIGEDGIVMAADDLFYTEKDGEAVPRANHIQKVFILQPNILIGIAGVGIHPKIEYEAQKWISDFIRSQPSETLNRPHDVASALCVKMRDTFQILETMPEDSLWKSHKPGDRVVSCSVAGYADSFRRPYLFEVWTQINKQGNGLLYGSEQRNGLQLFWLGEDIYWTRASSGEEPYASDRLKIYSEIATTFIESGMPASLREAILSITSLIKLEAKFNDKKVGSNVAVAVIDRTARTQAGFTF